MKKLTWEDLADIYNNFHQGRKAFTLPMDTVFDWAEKRTDLFTLDSEYRQGIKNWEAYIRSISDAKLFELIYNTIKVGE